MNLSSKLDMALDDVAAAGGSSGRGGRMRGGRPPTGGGREGGSREDGFNPYRNTAGRTHLAGASLQEIAAASDEERCAPSANARAPAAGLTRARHALRSVLKVGATTSAKTIAVRAHAELRLPCAPTIRRLAERAARFPRRAPSRT